jgi:hypothetical protein
MCQFAADQAEIAGNYTPANEVEITLSLPEITTKDLSRITTSINQLVMGLMSASDAGWISQETAATAFAKMLGELGIELNVTDELKQAEKEKTEGELDIVAARNGRLNQQMQQMAIDEPEMKQSNGRLPENVNAESGLNGAQVNAVLQVLDNLQQNLMPASVAAELLISVGIQSGRATRIVSEMDKVQVDSKQGNTSLTGNGAPASADLVGEPEEVE